VIDITACALWDILLENTWGYSKMSSDNSIAKIKPLSNSNYPEWCGEMKA